MGKRTLAMVSGLLLSFLGLVDSLYLVETQISNKPIICGFFEGCATVAESKYSVLFGVHLSSLGTLFYFALFIFFLLLLFVRVRLVRAAVLVLSAIGALASLYFVYLQFFVIQALCVYCMISAGIAVALFGISYTLFSKEASNLFPHSHSVIPPYNS